MAKVAHDRGSNRMGAFVIASVFGPMLLLALLWAGAVGVGESGSTRDAFGSVMVLVLLASGLLLIIEEVVLTIMLAFGRRHIAWPRSGGAGGAAKAPAEPGKAAEPPTKPGGPA